MTNAPEELLHRNSKSKKKKKSWKENWIKFLRIKFTYFCVEHLISLLNGKTFFSPFHFDFVWCDICAPGCDRLPVTIVIIKLITGPLRWKALECNCLHVQSSSNWWPTLFTIGTKRKCFIFCSYAACFDVTGKPYVVD